MNAEARRTRHLNTRPLITRTFNLFDAAVAFVGKSFASLARENQINTRLLRRDLATYCHS